RAVQVARRVANLLALRVAPRQTHVDVDVVRRLPAEVRENVVAFLTVARRAADGDERALAALDANAGIAAQRPGVLAPHVVDAFLERNERRAVLIPPEERPRGGLRAAGSRRRVVRRRVLTPRTGRVQRAVGRGLVEQPHVLDDGVVRHVPVREQPAAHRDFARAKRLRRKREEIAASLIEAGCRIDAVQLAALRRVDERGALRAPLEDLAAARGGIGDLVLVADRQRAAALEQVVDAARNADAVLPEMTVLVLAEARVEADALHVAIENDVDDAGRRVGAV